MNDYAVVIYFDERTSEELRNLIGKVASYSGNPYMVETGIPPHVTIGLFSADNEIRLRGMIGEFIHEFSGGEVVFHEISAFEPQVLFLSPIKNEYLVTANRRLNEIMEGSFSPADHNHYLPEYWVPHLALAVKLEKEQMKAAKEAVASLILPIVAQVTKVALARCNPYKELAVWELECDSE